MREARVVRLVFIYFCGWWIWIYGSGSCRGGFRYDVMAVVGFEWWWSWLVGWYFFSQGIFIGYFNVL